MGSYKSYVLCTKWWKIHQEYPVPITNDKSILETSNTDTFHVSDKHILESEQGNSNDLSDPTA